MIFAEKYRGWLRILWCWAYVCCASLHTSLCLATPNLNVPNSDLNEALHKGPQPLRALIARHLQMFPNSFPHANIYYMRFLDDMMVEQTHLLAHLNSLPAFRDDWSDHGDYIDLVIEAENSYDFRAKDFNSANLKQFEYRLNALVKKTGKKTLTALRKAIRTDLNEYIYNRDNISKERKGEFETMLVALIMLYGVTGHGKDQKLLAQDIVLEEGHIDYFAEDSMWKPALSFLNGEVSAGQRDAFWERAKKVADKTVKFLRNEEFGESDSQLKTVHKGDKLFLYEVPPELATLRGFVGNDCATSDSFGFPFSPFERVFYIATADKQFLGYLSYSHVERGKDPAIFFHTIAGPKITHAMTDMIIRGVYKARKDLGTEFMLLPEDYRIGENVNYQPIDQIMRKFAKDSNLERVKWLDKHYRDIIVAHGSTYLYDDPARNSQGRAIEPDTNAIKVKVIKRPIAQLGSDPGFCATTFE